MFDPTLRRLCEPMLARIGAALGRHVSANTITIAGFASGIVAAGLIAADLAPFALIFLVLSRAADGMDGAVARMRGPTVLGAFLDVSLDLIVYAGLPAAFAIRNPENGLAAAFLLFGFVSVMLLELSLRFFSRRATPPETPLQSQPLLGHSETFLAFAVACAYPPAFAVVAYVFGAACFVAIGMRVSAAVTHLSGAEP